MNEQYEALTAQYSALEQQVQDIVGALATPTPIPVVAYDKYGFHLPIPDGVDVRVAGLTGEEASRESGTLTASAGGTTLLLLWSSDGLTSAEAVQSSFGILRQATPGLDYVATAAGNLSVSGQEGSFGSFGAISADGGMVGIGLIGGWSCRSTGRTFAMTITGANVPAVESSFDAFTNGFECG